MLKFFEWHGRGEIKWPGLRVDERYKAAAPTRGLRGACCNYAYGSQQYGLQPPPADDYTSQWTYA